MNECAARNVTCNFCQKIRHFERTCRAKKNKRESSSVGVFQEQANFGSEEMGDEESQLENSVGWVNPTAEKRNRSWDSDSSGGGDYMMMAVRTKNQTELPITMNGRKTSVWVDSGSPISIFTSNDFRRTLGAAGIPLQDVDPQDQEFRDYGNNPINLLGTMKVELASNGWSTSAVIKLFGEHAPRSSGET